MQKYMFLVALVVDAFAKNRIKICVAAGGLKKITTIRKLLRFHYIYTYNRIYWS